MTRRMLLRAAVFGAVASVVVLLVPGTASAHPLGNFTVNRFSELVVGVESVRVDHVLDLAEIPTAQRTPAIDSDGDRALSRAELATYARDACADSADTLSLTVAGRPVALDVRRSTARTVAGQAGLPTMRVHCALSASTPTLAGPRGVSLVDTAADAEIGWREIIAVGDRTTVVESDVSARSTSRRLTRYPADLLSSPLDVRAANVRVTPGGPALGDNADVGGTGLPTKRLTGAFEGLVTTYDGNPLVVLGGLLAALALGAAHALAPGHGKTVMAFYLSGPRQGGVRAAGTVAATVTVTHTAGVLLLGVLVSAGTGFVPARLYPWLTVASGLLVAAVGVTLLRAARHPHTHEHPHPHAHAQAHRDVVPDHARLPVLVGAATQEHAETAHGHRDDGHRHDHGRHHDARHHSGHDHDGGHHQHRPASRRSLIAIGMAGGLVPSPSALVVFLAALAVGHAWFGVLLVVAFGLGMAVTLSAVGLLVMRLRTRFDGRLASRAGSRGARVLRALPLVTACSVLVLGLGIAARGVGVIGG